jgi:S1-C subfamily serine protease
MSTDESSLLKREIILPSSDRGRLAAIIATCSMAGLAGGMALSMLAESQRVADELRREQLEASMRSADEAAVPTAWLGIEIRNAPGKCAGAKVMKVVPGSPADHVGLRTGDVVEMFGGDAVCDDDHLIAVVHASSIGASPAVGVRRGAEHFVVEPKLGVMPRGGQ